MTGLPTGTDRIKALARDDQIVAELRKHDAVLQWLITLPDADWTPSRIGYAKWFLSAMHAHILVSDARVDEYRTRDEDGSTT
jgi:hypothetical protein